MRVCSKVARVSNRVSEFELGLVPHVAAKMTSQEVRVSALGWPDHLSELKELALEGRRSLLIEGRLK
jgi:hypothetical protein